MKKSNCRTFLYNELATGSVISTSARKLTALSSNGTVNLGFISCGGRGNQLIKEFKGHSGNLLHQRNLIDAVRVEDSSIFAPGVEVGHHSTGWCNLANIALQTGAEFSSESARGVNGAPEIWGELLDETKLLLGVHGIELESLEINLSLAEER